MSSCFLCDCSYNFKGASSSDAYNIVVGYDQIVQKKMKQLPIMIGSSGIVVDFDQQHNNNNKQNYVSYRVKKLEFCCSYNGELAKELFNRVNIPDYVLIFKVPFREPIFDYQFSVIDNFMLYSEPECVLAYKVLQPMTFDNQGHAFEQYAKRPDKFNININKPFVVGPSDYVGVLYMFAPPRANSVYINASARVWFDVV